MPSWLNWQLMVIIGLVVLMIVGFFFYDPLPRVGERIDNLIASAPTDVAQEGTLFFKVPAGSPPNLPSIAFPTANGATSSADLVFDPLSVCATPTGATACVALSVTYDIPFDGKRAYVEGTRNPDGTILVRKLEILREDQISFTRPTGSIFISWPQAVFLIEDCKVSMLMQTHALDVYMTLRDSREVRAVEPVIDEVFRVYSESQEKCGQIPIATE